MKISCDICEWEGDFGELIDHKYDVNDEDEPVQLCPGCTSSSLTFIFLENQMGNMTRRYETCPRCSNKKIVGTMCFKCLHKEHLKSLGRSKNR